MIVVLDQHPIAVDGLSWDALRAHGPTVVHDRTAPTEVVQRVGDAEIALTNKVPFTAETLARLPKLRYIGVIATGYNIVDVTAAKSRGVTVTNVPTYGTDSVAQFAFALLLELCHNVGRHAYLVRDGEWIRRGDWSFWTSPLVELAGKTMGIVGYGRIGRKTGQLAEAFGMRVIASDPVAPPDPKLVSLDELLAASDVVSLHCPLTPETNRLMDAARIGRMKRSAILLNTSRGPLVVEEDLAAALHSGHLAGAGLDVLAVEPPVERSPLYEAPNCLVTPHMAWATREARRRLLDEVIENVAAFLRGQPRNVVS
jgi:glycerate dehydrogenase